MSWLSRLFRRKALERDLERELQFHIAAATDDHVRDGLSRDEALRRARVELGGVEQVKEAARDVRGTRWIEDWWHDTRYALRAMARSPGFSAAAILTLAVGIGANAAVWSIVDALMMRALPVQHPDELHALQKVGTEENSYLMSHTRFRRLQSEFPDSARVAAMSALTRAYATIGDQPEAVQMQLVSGEWFPLLGVGTTRGRPIGAEDQRTLGAHPVAVLSDAYWTRRFGRDPRVLGSSIRVNGAPLTVVGVTEPGFFGLIVGQSIDMWIPLVMQHEVRYQSDAYSSNADTEKPWVPQEGIAWLTSIARVTPDEITTAQAKLDRRFRADVKQQVAGRDSAAREYAAREHLALQPIGRGFSPLRTLFSDPLRALMGGVGLVLLIACGNLAALLMSRSAARTHEIAVRVSLGAQPGRLVRQALTESVTLAMIGGALSLLVAHWGSAVLLRAASTGTRAIPLAVAIDGRVMLFAFGISLVTGLLFGLAPAMHAARTSLYDVFRGAGRGSRASLHHLPLGRLLVVSQIALSLVLVSSAGVFLRTLRNALSIDPGYSAERVANARLDVRAAGYGHEQLPALYQRLLDEVRAVPGVASVSLSLNGIAGGARRTSGFVIPGKTFAPGESGGQENWVTPDYFGTVGMVLLRGRTLAPTDKPGSQRVAVVSEAMAKHFFGTVDVVGEKFGYGTPPKMEIVGVVRDARVNMLREQPQRLVFYPLAQGPQEYVTSLEARIVGPPDAALAGIRNAIARVDRSLPVREVVVLRDLLERGLWRERLVARLAGGFGVIALLLAGIGLYGVMTYSVSRRTNEMGIRLALGAPPAAVRWLVLRDSLVTILLGVVLGIGLSFPLLGLTSRLVYGLSPRDPATMTVAAALLAAVGILAAVLPAWRAARIDPVEAMRAE